VPRHGGLTEERVKPLCIGLIWLLEPIALAGLSRGNDDRWPDDQRLSSAPRWPLAFVLHRSAAAWTSRTEIPRCAAISTSVNAITRQR
jgi:hypothetical protein